MPFKFVNALIAHPYYLDTVKDYWSLTTPLYSSTAATYMFSKKLKLLKSFIRRLGKQFIANIQERTKAAYDDLCTAQVDNHNNPTTSTIERELAAQHAWENLSEIEEKYLKQKAKIHWLQVGDRNNAYFHNTAKSRQARNSIKEIHDAQGNILTAVHDIKKEAARFFEEFLTTMPTDLVSPSIGELETLVQFKCSESDKEVLLKAVSNEEIKKTLFCMTKNKSPGPNGYTAEFYTSAWSIVGDDFITAIQSFFTYGFLPKGVNSTILALIPKTTNVSEMRDFRPISCCNVLYKVISKILAARLKLILPRVILRNQSAFVQGRLLMENVLLATELVKDYHKDFISRRCTTKIDISKAFDTIQWSFLRDTLVAMEVPDTFIKWIMLCISTASFSVQVNGELSGYFTSKRGLRQGCSLSPYLFVICLNVLSNMLDRACLVGRIGFHPKCRNLTITHLCFADDILIFSDGTHNSMSGILEIFESFA